MGRAKTKAPPTTPGWVFYGRTSDEDAQAPERSLGSQRRLCTERLIDGSGLPLLEEYKDIYSGRSADRKNYQLLLSNARDGKFSHVAIAFVDRFGRNDVEGIRAFDELTKLGIKVRIATYPSLDPAMADGRMIVTMLFGVAQFEAARISERCREGMHSKLLGGDWAWKAPDGYVNREEKLSSANLEDKLKHAKYKRWVEIDPEQSKVWRYAWDLLLTDTMGLRQICEALHAKGYRLRSGGPFVKLDSNGSYKYAISIVARIFHNWFYAGWVVIDTNWATIAPKTLKGNWTPIVSTDELEAGMSILVKRDQTKHNKRKHFYLLQGLISLQKPDGGVVKLICSMPNANRDRGGVAYYCIPSSNVHFLCGQVDVQIPDRMHNIQVDATCLRQIRELYVHQLEDFVGRPNTDERATLEKSLKDLAEEELRCARLHAKQQVSDETWTTLWKEWQDQRGAIKANLEAMDRNCQTHIATLDEALRLIGKAGILFDKLPKSGQQDLLRHMVKRVVINPEGQILRMDLQPPFSYLQGLVTLAKGAAGPNEPQNGSKTTKHKTSRRYSTSSSNFPLREPGGTRTLNQRIKSPMLYH
jgi:DNA invertase Pin-like site-specific DNA recombinase